MQELHNTTEAITQWFKDHGCEINGFHAYSVRTTFWIRDTTQSSTSTPLGQVFVTESGIKILSSYSAETRLREYHEPDLMEGLAKTLEEIKRIARVCRKEE